MDIEQYISEQLDLTFPNDTSRASKMELELLMKQVWNAALEEVKGNLRKLPSPSGLTLTITIDDIDNLKNYPHPQPKSK